MKDLREPTAEEKAFAWGFAGGYLQACKETEELKCNRSRQELADAIIVANLLIEVIDARR